MDQQLTLFQTPEPLRNKYRLFLGIFPVAEAANLICAQLTHLCKEFGLRGIPRPLSHLHVTLLRIGDYLDVPEQEITAAIKVCASTLAHQTSFEVTFDHVMSFRGESNRNPFVLVNPSGNDELLELHRVLVTDLVKHRLAKPKDLKIVPHVTMLYDKHIAPVRPVSPVKWAVTEVVLVLSHLGQTKYERLEYWKLNTAS